MAPQVPNHRKGLLLIIIADIIWGTVFVASQVGLEYTNPFNVAFLRFFIATLAIVALMPFAEKRLDVIGELRKKWTWLFGLLYAIGFIFQYLGQALTSAPEATLLTNLSPILIPPLALLITKERVTKTQIVAIAIGITGLFLVANPTMTTGVLARVGDILMVLTSLCYALFTILTKKRNASSAGNSFAIIIVVTIIALPVALTVGDLRLSSLAFPAIAWIAIIYLGIVCTAIAITIYLKGLSGVLASEAAVMFLVQLLVGLVLSGLLLGEYLSLYQTIGASAILLALIFGVRVGKRSG
jgi:drug/metabolite transporter (DMT)-like permease